MEPYKWSRSMHINYIVPSASLAQCAAMYCCIKSLPQVRAQVLSHVSPRQTRGLQVLTRAAAANNELPPPDVRKLAQLAQLSVTDEEVQEWEPKLQSILGWFAQLQQADVSGVEPAVRADINTDTVLRDDIPVDYSNREALLAEVPSREGAFVKVPKIM